MNKKEKQEQSLLEIINKSEYREPLVIDFYDSRSWARVMAPKGCVVKAQWELFVNPRTHTQKTKKVGAIDEQTVATFKNEG